MTPADGMSFSWKVSPDDEIIPRLEEYGQRILIAVQQAANYWAAGTVNAMRNDAPWVDRTGLARSGLFFAVDGFGLDPIMGEVTPETLPEMTDTEIISGDAETLVIALGHTVFYGKYLELSRGGKDAIVMSTVERRLPYLIKLIERAVTGK